MDIPLLEYPVSIIDRIIEEYKAMDTGAEKKYSRFHIFYTIFKLILYGAGFCMYYQIAIATTWGVWFKQVKPWILESAEKYFNTDIPLIFDFVSDIITLDSSRFYWCLFITLITLIPFWLIMKMIVFLSTEAEFHDAMELERRANAYWNYEYDRFRLAKAIEWCCEYCELGLTPCPVIQGKDNDRIAITDEWISLYKIIYDRLEYKVGKPDKIEPEESVSSLFEKVFPYVFSCITLTMSLFTLYFSLGEKSVDGATVIICFLLIFSICFILFRVVVAVRKYARSFSNYKHTQVKEIRYMMTLLEDSIYFKRALVVCDPLGKYAVWKEGKDALEKRAKEDAENSNKDKVDKPNDHK